MPMQRPPRPRLVGNPEIGEPRQQRFGCGVITGASRECLVLRPGWPCMWVVEFIVGTLQNGGNTPCLLVLIVTQLFADIGV